MQIYERRRYTVQRDMDLIRELLLEIADRPELDGTRHWVDFSKESKLLEHHSVEELAYHVDLLFEAGFVKGVPTSDFPLVTGLTWGGHEFIGAIRDASIWGKVKERIKGLPGVTISVIFEIAKAEIMKLIGPK